MKLTVRILLGALTWLTACSSGSSGTDPDAGTDTDTYADHSSLTWVVQAGGPGNDVANAVATLPDGSAFVTGEFEDTAVFGPGEPGETSIVAESECTEEEWGYLSCTSNAFVARYEADGTLAWVSAITGPEYATGRDVAITDEGGAVVTGVFRGNASFGSDVENQVTLLAHDREDIFVASYETDGSLAWAVGAGGVNSDSSEAIVVHEDGSVAVTGKFRETALFGEGESNEIELTATSWTDDVDGWPVPMSDLFVAQWSADGALEWAVSAGGDFHGYAEGRSIGALANGAALVAGVCGANSTFGHGEPNETLIDETVFVARYQADGSFSWITGIDGAGSADVSALPEGAFTVTGRSYSPIVFAPDTPQELVIEAEGNIHVFVAWYDPEGNPLQAVLDGGGGAEYLSSSVAALANGSALVAGWFEKSIVLGVDSEEETAFESAGNDDDFGPYPADLFVARYTASGSLAWAVRAGGAKTDEANGITALADGSSLVVGSFQDTATFGPYELGEVSLTTAGQTDAFLMRLNP